MNKQTNKERNKKHDLYCIEKISAGNLFGIWVENHFVYFSLNLFLNHIVLKITTGLQINCSTINMCILPEYSWKFALYL